MATRTICVALLLASLSIAGCGTVANQVRLSPEDGKTPFGGVKHDVVCIQKAREDSENSQRLARMILCAVDLPFSLIGDVVLWPYTVTFNFINQPPPVPPVAQAPVVPQPQIAP